MGYTGIKLHPVAGKCGVFAETDINGLQKMGVPPDELMASLFEPIIGQNLSVLTRGNTLRPRCCCSAARTPTSAACSRLAGQHPADLGGAQGRRCPRASTREDLINVPENAQYFAALGAVEFGKTEDESVGVYRGTEAPAPLHRRRPRRGEGRRPAARASPRPRRSSTRSRSATGSRSSVRPTFAPGPGGARASSASTAAPPPPRRCCSTRTATSSPRPTSSPRATRSRTRWRCSRKLRAAGRGPGRHPRGPRRRHHRLRQGHPEGRPATPTWRWSRPWRTPSRRCTSTTTPT